MLSKSCKYAIRAVLYLAIHADEKHKLGVKEIAEDLDVPKHFLGKILQRLSRHNLVSSSKGPTGGFYLDEDNLHLNIRMIVESIDGEDVFNSCILGLPNCNNDQPCVLHNAFSAYRDRMLSVFEGQTIIEAARKVEDRGNRL